MHEIFTSYVKVFGKVFPVTVWHNSRVVRLMTNIEVLSFKAFTRKQESHQSMLSYRLFKWITT